MKKISKGLIALIVVLVCVLGIFSFYKNTYNSMVSLEEDVSASWAEVQNQYQRRADLVPNLVNTVKGYAAHEKSTFEAVTEAHTKASSINLTVDDLTEENLEKFQKAQDELGSTLSRLMAVAEAYPDLKANENFMDLQAQLEGTEKELFGTLLD